MRRNFQMLSGKKLPLPLFFPDATRGEIRQLQLEDVTKVGLPGILVNTFHLLRIMGEEKTRNTKGIRNLIGWDGAIISDSGGFQVMSIAKKNDTRANVTDEGVVFEIDGHKHDFSPEDSIRYQVVMQTDLVVVLDDFTPPQATHEEAEKTVQRTTLWARKCKDIFESECERLRIPREKRPYLIGVVQGGYFEDLRMKSIRELTQIGFDGYGYGGWPMKEGVFDLKTARLIADNLPKNTLLYGLGIGKPDDIVACVKLGYQVFDCVLPTRDARHGRLYVYTAKSIEAIDLTKPNFYEYYIPRKREHLAEMIPVSSSCDCELCTTLTRAEFAQMWRERNIQVLRLATIHNLRFYAILMEKLRRQENGD